MGEDAKKLYACCPICAKPIGKSKRCDGMEITCTKCGNLLQVIVNEETGVSVKLVQEPPDPVLQKPNKNSVAPRNAGLG